MSKHFANQKLDPGRQGYSFDGELHRKHASLYNLNIATLFEFSPFTRTWIGRPLKLIEAEWRIYASLN